MARAVSTRSRLTGIPGAAPLPGAARIPRLTAGHLRAGALTAAVAAAASLQALTGWESSLFAVAYVGIALAAGRMLTWEPALATAWLIAVAAQLPTALGSSDEALVLMAQGAGTTAVAWAVLLMVQFQRERIDVMARVEEVPLLDEASGLANVRALELRAASELSRARRHEQPLTVLWLVLDAPHAGAEAGGVAAADDAARAAGVALLTAVRGEDLVARVGLRELAVLLPDAGPVESRIVAERIEGALARAAAEGAPLHGRAAVHGSAHFPADALAVDELLGAARRAAREEPAG